ncbi:hypothetical protein T06_12909 [Trichinella sp. T6]|nr:hypothetical protein T06_12909 [Trichinella sp. T6]
MPLLPYGNRLKKHFMPVVTRETSADCKRLNKFKKQASIVFIRLCLSSKYL